MVTVRSTEELVLIKKSGEITAKALKKAILEARVGMTLVELDKIAEEEILRLGGGSSFKVVPGYYWTTCLTINEEVVHGIPRDIKLKEGDLLSIDLGAVYQGWHTDAAWSIIIGTKKDEEKQRFLKIGQEALGAGIKKAVGGNRVGDISAAIEEVVEGAGYAIVKSLTGHGVGRSPHEEPEIPGFGKAGTGMVLREGMTLAIEVIYTSGSGEVGEKEDGWTIAALDNSLGGLFEMSVIVGKTKAEILTDWRGA